MFRYTASPTGLPRLIQRGDELHVRSRLPPRVKARGASYRHQITGRDDWADSGGRHQELGLLVLDNGLPDSLVAGLDLLGQGVDSVEHRLDGFPHFFRQLFPSLDDPIHESIGRAWLQDDAF